MAFVYHIINAWLQCLKHKFSSISALSLWLKLCSHDCKIVNVLYFHHTIIYSRICTSCRLKWKPLLLSFIKLSGRCDFKHDFVSVSLIKVIDLMYSSSFSLTLKKLEREAPSADRWAKYSACWYLMRSDRQLINTVPLRLWWPEFNIGSGFQKVFAQPTNSFNSHAGTHTEERARLFNQHVYIYTVFIFFCFHFSEEAYFFHIYSHIYAFRIVEFSWFVIATFYQLRSPIFVLCILGRWGTH